MSTLQVVIPKKATVSEVGELIDKHLAEGMRLWLVGRVDKSIALTFIQDKMEEAEAYDPNPNSRR